MRPLVRIPARALLVRLTAPAAVATGLCLASACGGANGQDVSEPSATGSSGGTSGTSGGTSGTSGGSGTSGTSGAGGTPDAAVDAGSCPPETEPNDSKETANTLSPTLCGVISPDSESDFLTFQLKPASTSLQITFTGQVTLKVTVAGNSVTLSGTNSVKVPLVKGQRYSVEVKAAAQLPNVAWRVNLIEM
jgi:hypothetical protein